MKPHAELSSEFSRPLRRTSYAASRVGAVVLVALLACGKPPSAGKSEPTAPKGEVWLSAEQLTEAQVKVAPAAEHPLRDVLLTSGRVAFDDTKVTHVFSPVTGRVVAMRANLGDHVKEEAPLAVLESPDLGAAHSDVLKAEADLTAARHDYERQKDLAASKATPQAVLEQSEDNFRRAEAEMARTKLKLSMLHVKAEDAEESASPATGGGRRAGASNVSQQYTLRSPIAGEVVARTINPGVEVQGMYSQASIATELFTVGSLDKVWVWGDVYEQDLARVKRGQPVTVTSVAYPGRQFNGRVDWVSPVLDPTTRTARLRCLFDNPDRALKPEMYATVAVTIGERQGLAIARDAVVKLGEVSVVFVEAGASETGVERFVARPVQLGSEADGVVEIVKGLQAGERVVVAGAILLSGAL